MWIAPVVFALFGALLWQLYPLVDNSHVPPGTPPLGAGYGVVVITDYNRYIYTSAQYLASIGNHVLVGVATETDKKAFIAYSELKGVSKRIEAIVLDLSEPSHIQRLFNRIDALEKSLNLKLVGFIHTSLLDPNAPVSVTIQDLEESYQSVLTGSVRIMQGLLPKLIDPKQAVKLVLLQNYNTIWSKTSCDSKCIVSRALQNVYESTRRNFENIALPSTVTVIYTILPDGKNVHIKELNNETQAAVMNNVRSMFANRNSSSTSTKVPRYLYSVHTKGSNVTVSLPEYVSSLVRFNHVIINIPFFLCDFIFKLFSVAPKLQVKFAGIYDVCKL